MTFVIEWVDSDPQWPDRVRLTVEGDETLAIATAERMARRPTESARVFDDAGRCIYDSGKELRRTA